MPDYLQVFEIFPLNAFSDQSSNTVKIVVAPFRQKHNRPQQLFSLRDVAIRSKLIATIAAYLPERKEKSAIYALQVG